MHPQEWTDMEQMLHFPKQNKNDTLQRMIAVVKILDMLFTRSGLTDWRSYTHTRYLCDGTFYSFMDVPLLWLQIVQNPLVDHFLTQAHVRQLV